MRILISPLVAAGVALAALAPAAAISSYNATPAPERTEVGTMVLLRDTSGDSVPDLLVHRCTGTMIDGDTFLTAAHCQPPAGTTHVYVSLLEDVRPRIAEVLGTGLTPQEAADLFLSNGWMVEGDWIQDPAYPGNSKDSHDIAVIDFSTRAVTPADLWEFTPATLPAAGKLSALGARKLEAMHWFVVGYGSQEAVTGQGGQVHPGGGTRLKADLGFDALNASWVRLAQRESQGYGGACYGDSGGPNFVDIGGTRTLAATTITGDGPCYATNVAYRMDTRSARGFLAPFVVLP